MAGIAAAAWLTVFLADQLQPSSTPLSLRPGNEGAAALAPGWTGLRSKPWPRRNGGRDPQPPTSKVPARPGSPNLAFRPAGSVSDRDLASPGPWPQRPSDPSRLSLPGSLLLGGPLSLSSLQEKLMVPAARAEQAQRDAAADRLKGLPPRWRYAIRWLTHGSRQLLPAEVVRLPAPYLQQPEEIPLAMTGDSLAETTVRPSSAHSKRALERWAERQPRVPDGQVRPVLVVLEPMTTAGASTAGSARAQPLTRVLPSCLEATSPAVQAFKPGIPTATPLPPQPNPGLSPGEQEPRPAAAAKPVAGVEPIPASALIGTPLPP
ncbi:MAG: hypothetical protein ACKN89_07130 [Cyanobium sp.]